MRKNNLVKILPAVIALLASLALIPLSPPLALAVDPAMVSIPYTTVGSGDTVTLPISITDVTNLGTATIWLSYDKYVVTVDSVANGNMGTVTYALYNNEGVTKMTWYDAYGKTGDYVFAYVTLRAASTSTDLTCSLHLEVKEFMDTSFNAITPIVSDGTFSIDVTSPTVTLVIPAPSLLADAQVGANNFTVTVDYSEPMDTEINPTITFDPVVTTTLTPASGTWADANTYLAAYNVADGGVKVDGVDIAVSGARDVAGNLQVIHTAGDVFNIDTENPAINSVTPADGATAVAADAAVSAIFSEGIQQGDNFGSISISGATGVSVSIGGTNLNIAHGDFNCLTTYTATIPAGGIEDLAGNPNSAYSWSFTSLMEGDVNGSGYVSGVDALLIARYSVGLESLSDYQKLCADTTDEGNVSTADAMHIAQWVVDPSGAGGVLAKDLWQEANDSGITVPPQPMP